MRLAEWWQTMIKRNGFGYPILIQDNGSSFLLTIKYPIFLFKKMIPDLHEYAEMWHIMMTSINVPMMSLDFQNAAVRFLSFPQAGTGYVR